MNLSITVKKHDIWLIGCVINVPMLNSPVSCVASRWFIVVILNDVGCFGFNVVLNRPSFLGTVVGQPSEGWPWLRSLPWTKPLAASSSDQL